MTMKTKLIAGLLAVIVTLQCVIVSLTVSLHYKTANLECRLKQQRAIQLWTYDAQIERHIIVMQQLDRLLCDKTKDDLAP